MTTPKLAAMLQYDEGFELRPYKDSEGFWTGGIGHLLSTTAHYDPKYDHYTRQNWLDVFATDIGETKHRLDIVIPHWRTMNGVHQDVFVNLAFNLGADKLATWHHTVADFLSGNFKAEGVDLRNDQPWASQVHDRSKRLANLAETGIYSKDNYPI